MPYEEPRKTEMMLPDTSELARAAWNVRTRARVHGETSVGCAVMDERENIFRGCNIEHRYRSHDIHAEVNAISSLVAGGGSRVVAIFIAAERERFTPCGSCLDWIFEVGDEETIVLTQRVINGPIATHLASELMPYYPK